MRKKKKQRPTVAPGNDNFLKAKATTGEIQIGDYTKVTTLSFDEVDPSKE